MRWDNRKTDFALGNGAVKTLWLPAVWNKLVGSRNILRYKYLCEAVWLWFSKAQRSKEFWRKSKVFIFDGLKDTFYCEARFMCLQVHAEAKLHVEKKNSFVFVNCERGWIVDWIDVRELEGILKNLRSGFHRSS